MPLFDHFHPPLSQRRPWDSFHSTWATAIADALNQGVLPPGYIALEHIHAGAPAEIDVATFEEEVGLPEAGPGGTATVTRKVWTPAAPPLVLPASFPEHATIEVIASDGGRTLAAAIELLSPGNKDRERKRRLFASKCAAYLAHGVGLVIVDVVTNRLANLHNELMDLLGLPTSFAMPADQTLYVVAYRPLRRDQEEVIETWPMPLGLGLPLPTVPLSLETECCIPVDLESTYLDACQRRRLDEVV
jgi:Protein of unknown function (DUF4058)